MKTKLMNALAAVILLLIPNVNFGQAPTLGATSSFALFTAAGAVNNGGSSNITGDIGSFTVTPIGFPGSGTVTGTIYNVGDPILTQAAADVGTAYSHLFSLTPDTIIGTTLGSGQSLPPKIYSLGAASTINGVLTLDGHGDPNALFIFQVSGALSATASANVKLINSASICNVYWQVGGAFTLVSGSIFTGTMIANGAISLSGSTLNGRALTTAGIISTSAITEAIPTSCGVISVGIPVFTMGANSTRCQGAGTVTYTATATNSTGITYSLDATSAAFAGNSIVAGTGAVTYAAGWSGTTIITVSAAGVSGPTTATHTVTISVDNTVTLSSAVGTDAQTKCINAAITNITYSTTGATGATVTGLPAGVADAWAANVVTISGTPTASGIFNYTVTLTGGCGTITKTGSLTVSINTASLSSAVGTDAQTKCISSAITNITYATTGATDATVTGLPAGVTGNWATNVVTISGTPSESGTFDYTVTLIGGCGTITKTGTIIISATNTASLSSAVGTDAQTKCINTAITNITYATTGATGATVSGLPAGVTGSWATNVETISGTPTASGTFNYTVTLTGGCGTITKTGTIIVTANNTVTLSSSVGTDTQTKFIGTAITNITYATTGATGATCSGLPAGVTGAWATNIETISGTPTVAGIFNYTVTLIGGCGTITKTGTITVTTNNTITLSSAVGTDAQTKCINMVITNITYTTTGATGATFSGLPAGVSGSWAANVVTISGTPTASGTFDYTITLTGGIGTITKTGTITVIANNTVTLSSAVGTDAQTKCINTAITNITYATLRATGANVTGLPAGVTGVWAANIVTISGTPTTSGTFNYTVTLLGGCDTITKTGSITVTANNTITLSSAVGTDAQTKCISSAITNITYATTGATDGTVTGLPAGVTGTWATNIVTISGTPTASGTFNYTVTLLGGCGTITKTGTLTVTANTITLGSAVGTNAQTKCINTAITNITYATTGATGAIVTGLPAGVIGSWTTNVVMISGTPTTSGTFNYTVTLTGGCGLITVNGSIIVNPTPASAGTITGTAMVCQGQTDVTYTVPVIANATSYIWKLPVGAIIKTGANANSIKVDFNATAASGNMTVQGSNICSSGTVSVNYAITVNMSPASIAGVGRTICQSENTQIGATAVSGNTYSWSSTPSGFTSILANPIVNSLVTTIYTLTETITATSCYRTNSVTVTVNTAPKITREPNNQMTTDGSSLSFTVTATGTGNTYQWRKGNLELTDEGNISGVTSSKLTFNPANISDTASNYNVVITGTCAPKSISSDAILWICSCTTGIPTFKAVNTTEAVTIYPNPFTSAIDILINDASQINRYEMRIYNASGTMVMITTLRKQITTLETSNLPSGIYFYKVIGNDKIIQSGKLISQ